MANVALLDLDMDGVDFDAAHAAMLVFKRNRDGGNKTDRARWKAIAEWANFVDDCMRALQRWTRDLETRVTALESGGGVVAAVHGTGAIDVDATDPENPVVHSTFYVEQYDGGGIVEACEGIQFDQAAGFVLDDTASPLSRISFSPTTGGLTSRIGGSATPQTVTDTITPTDILAFSLPAGRLTAGHKIRVRMGGQYVNTSGGVRTYTIEISIGGTTLWGTASNSNASTALEVPWELDFEIAAESNTLVHLHGRKSVHTTNTATIAGLGALTASQRSDVTISSVRGGVTVPSLASIRTVSVTITHSFQSASIILTRNQYSVELI